MNNKEIFISLDALWFLTWRQSGSDELLVSSHGHLLSATQPITRPFNIYISMFHNRLTESLVKKKNTVKLLLIILFY